ncbi:GNAT family N-acetyltransferase [Tsuneonella sp. YG55]|uniref:GNAT family N-acetyltransferase n=1 Tax=Tsuneonella litorea TaxID=2976475 RepID=A0A9X2W1E3_9SPHN|nr:GNAT family N-acetyltransferase [Tsuneonella litorea]MCT2558221.1 GNAT family N-acetyltransferase [Tsuneonella litorea]
MTGHPLDRPVWNCLTGPQAHLARREGQAVLFDPAIGPFAACADGTAEGLAARLDGPFWLVETAEVAPSAGLILDRSAQLTQMVAESPVIGDIEAGLVPLGENDADDMARLAHATQPGPWSSSTHRFGGFYGIRDGGELIAMAGTRMRPSTRFAEVSGVCTAPAARGRGLARRLMMRVMADMVARRETPFLHSYSANDGAIRLYRSLGFVERRQMVVTILEAA